MDRVLQLTSQALVVTTLESNSSVTNSGRVWAYASPRMFPHTPPHNHLYLCVSRFAEGQPLELVSASEWATLVREVANMLGVMRTITPPARSVVPTWPEVLLGHDTDDTRLDGWQAKLANYPDLLEPYQTAQERLRRLCALPPVANVSPSLLHCDLINRNVHVNHGAITGVFDWGCRRWGDHLYDLAWFEFWAPWHRSIDVDALRSELVNRWGYTPNQDRLDACLTHIGVDHLVYNAMVGDHCSGREVSDRLIELGLI